MQVHNPTTCRRLVLTSCIIIGFMRYGDEWRKHRRLFTEMFRREAAQEHLDIQAQKVGEFMVNIRKEPEHFMGHIRT